MEKRWIILAAFGIVVVLIGTLYFFGFFGPPPVTITPQTNPALPQTFGPAGTVTAYYFYGDGCTHCANIKPHLVALAAKYPNLELKQLEV